MLALGGGGARGFAHIGVLRVLERESIPIRGIAGTSMGAIVGALYAQEPDSTIVEEKIKEFLRAPLFTQVQGELAEQKGPGSFLEHLAGQFSHQEQNSAKIRARQVDMDREMTKALQNLLGDKNIRDAKIPFAAVATDLRTGAEVVLEKGAIIQAVLASAAMPGVLSPVKLDGYLLTDGAATSAVPVRAAKKLSHGARVLAVDVSSQLVENPPLDNPLQVVLRSSAITGACYHKELIHEADVLIQPHVKLFSWSEFDNVEDFISEGEQAAMKKLPVIKKMARWF